MRRIPEDRIEKLIEEYDREMKEISDHIKHGNITFNRTSYNGNIQEGFIHPSTKIKGSYQFTYFDNMGPIGDMIEKSKEELAERIYNMGFKPCEKNNFLVII